MSAARSGGRRGPDPRVLGLEQDPARVARLRALLTEWYEGARRDLPWRRTSDPYRVWISEAMLQQTRVEAVLDHYARFLARFPGVRALAAADEDEVVGMWSGLGYYNRARTLRRAARVVVDEHGGRFPDTPEAARALPGVGAYTVGAVLSIAYGRGVPLVDGNVARVLARLFALREEVDRAPTQRLLWGLAEVLVPPDHPDPRDPSAPGAWNQALMELGATVCTPRAPRCLTCPLHAECAARAEGVAERLPAKRPRRAPVDVRLEVLVARRGEGAEAEVLLVRRPRTDRMGGMWELPTRELPADEGADDGGDTLLWPRRPHGPAGLVEARPAASFGTITHGITHHRITAELRPAEAAAAVVARADADAAGWYALDALEGVALTGLTRKALRRVRGADDAG